MPRALLVSRFSFEQRIFLTSAGGLVCMVNTRSVFVQLRHQSSAARDAVFASKSLSNRDQVYKPLLVSSKQSQRRGYTASIRDYSMASASSPAVTSRLSRPLPEGTIDSHCHIIPPDFERFPISKAAQYEPKPHTISDATSFYTTTSGLGISTPRMVLTQVSIYGTDNSAVLSGVAELGNNGRGVAEFTPDVPVSQLQELWSNGIRGVRINLVSRGATIEEPEFESLLQSYVDKLSQMKMPEAQKKWVIEMYISLNDIPMLRSILPRIKNANAVRWCVDHFGGLKFGKGRSNFSLGDDPYQVTGFKELVSVVSDPELPEVYVKLSAAYRIDAGYPSKDALNRLGAFGRELINKAEDRVCWASDWPHTRFEDVDSIAFVEACYEWCGDGNGGDERREKLFRLNSERLWDMN